jgi:hypothetical protein
MRSTYCVFVAAVIWATSGMTAQAQPEADRRPAGRVVQLLEESGYRYAKETPWLWSLPFIGTKMAHVPVWVMTNDEELIVEGVIARRDQVVGEPEVMRQLLIMNGAVVGPVFLVDEEGNYVARSRFVLEQLDVALFQSSIQAIVATTDEAYGVIAGWVSSETPAHLGVAARAVGVPPGTTTQLDILQGQASISFNSLTWKETRSLEAGKRMFEHVGGAGFAMVVAESINIPTERLRERALANMRKTASEVQVINAQQRRVNGTDVMALQTDVTVRGRPFTYLGYYYGGSAGTVQVVTYADRTRFEEYRREFEQFLNGLRIVARR